MTPTPDSAAQGGVREADRDARDEIYKQLKIAAVELARDRDNAVFAMASALHSQVPEDQRPMSQSDYSDDQWARLTEAYHVVRLAIHDQRTKALARAALRPSTDAAAQPSDAPEDFVTVPREPTEAMLRAAVPDHFVWPILSTYWSAMLAAAKPLDRAHRGRE